MKIRRPRRSASCARKAATAQTGFELLTRFHPSNAYLDEVAYCYAARGLVADPLPSDDDEFIERRVAPLADAVRMALDGEITGSVSKVALLQYALRASDRSGRGGPRPSAH